MSVSDPPGPAAASWCCTLVSSAISELPGPGAPPPFMLRAGTSLAGGGGGGGRESRAELAPRVGVPEGSVRGGGAGGGWEGRRWGVP